MWSATSNPTFGLHKVLAVMVVTCSAPIAFAQGQAAPSKPTPSATTSQKAQPHTKIWFQGEQTIGMSADGVYLLVAGAGTIVAFDGRGLPGLISFAVPTKDGTDGIIQGKFGIDGTGRPENSGRVIYKQGLPDRAMPYLVTGAHGIYKYHLKYLELTTVGKGQDYHAYAVKALAFDNVIETPSKDGKQWPATARFRLSPDGQLAVDNGKIKIGDSLISPNYDLSGKIP